MAWLGYVFGEYDPWSGREHSLNYQRDEITHKARSLCPGHSTRGVWYDTWLENRRSTCSRSGLSALFAYAHPGDVLVVESLDRLLQNVEDARWLFHTCVSHRMGLVCTSQSLELSPLRLGELAGVTDLIIDAIKQGDRRDLLFKRIRKSMQWGRSKNEWPEFFLRPLLGYKGRRHWFHDLRYDLAGKLQAWLRDGHQMPEIADFLLRWRHFQLGGRMWTIPMLESLVEKKTVYDLFLHAYVSGALNPASVTPWLRYTIALGNLPEWLQQARGDVRRRMPVRAD